MFFHVLVVVFESWGVLKCFFSKKQKRDSEISRYLVLVIFKGSIKVQWPKRNTRISIYTCFLKMSSCSPHQYFDFDLPLLILFWSFILVYHFHLFSEITMAESNCKCRCRERHKQEDDEIFARMASYQAWYQCNKIRRMMLTIMVCYMVATFIALTTFSLLDHV